MKRFTFFYLFFVVLTFFSCSTLQATLIEREERMFWELQGPKGSVYVLGTMHLGTDELYPIEQPVIEAFSSSDSIYAEVSDTDMTELSEQVKSKMFESSYLVPPERHAYQYLTEQEIEQFEDLYVRYLRDNMETAKLQNIPIDVLKSSLKAAEPWVLSSVIDTIASYQAGFSSELGIDMYFFSLATLLQKKVKGLDTIKTQISVLVGMPYEYQLYSLKDTLKKMKTGEYESEMEQLFSSYTNNDKKTLTKILNDTNKEIDIAILEEYRALLLTNRNANWVKIVKKLLKQGGNAFIFAGAGHFLGEKSVFDLLEKEGILKQSN